MSDVSDPPCRRPATGVLVTTAFAVSIALGFAGATDAMLSLDLAGQFVRGIAKIEFVFYAGAVHGLVGFLVGASVGSAALGLFRLTRFGELTRFIVRDHEHRRSTQPASSLASNAVFFGIAPALVACLVVVHRTVLPFVSGRQAIPLVVIVVMASTLVAIAMSIPLAFMLGRIIELACRPVMKYPRVRNALTWIGAPIAVTCGLAICVTIAWIAHRWSSLEVRAFRGPVILLLGAVTLLPPAYMLSRAGTAWLEHRRTWWRRIAYALAALAPLVTVIVLGSDIAVIKATTAHTELGGRMTRAIRRAFDWDRDGFARILGGGDCNDSDSRIHPGAHDIAGDGIDQNCLGGDARKPTAQDPSFADAGSSVGLNILLITIDTLRADHLGYAGYPRPTSANLDKLAAKSVVFLNGWSNAASTYLAMPALLTGRMPLAVRARGTLEGSKMIAPEATTLAEALIGEGYVTGAITNLPYFEPERGLNQGFAEYDNENAQLHERAGKGDARGSSAPQQTAKALAFVDRHVSKKWFLWVHYFEPHYRYERHEGQPGFGSLEIDLYDGEIRYADEAIGQLIEGLSAKGVLDRTIIAITSDHGESFGEHGLAFHANHLYGAQTRVPYLAWVPGFPAGRITTPIGHTDLYATLVNLAGGSPSPEMMGRSMVDVLQGKEIDHVVFQELSAKSAQNMRAAATRTCHVIYSTAPDTAWEVYRIDRDPDETTDLANTDECADVRAALAQRYDVMP